MPIWISAPLRNGTLILTRLQDGGDGQSTATSCLAMQGYGEAVQVGNGELGGSQRTKVTRECLGPEIPK